MDADEGLSELRTIAFIASTIVDGGEIGDWWATMTAFIDAFKALDEHLSDGGRAPAAWTPKPIEQRVIDADEDF